ncbi:MAG: YncE family protein [Thermoplasmata archaeon]
MGLDPLGIALDAANGDFYIAESDFNDVYVVSGITDHVLTTIPVGDGPYEVTYDSGKGELFVTDFYGDNVSVISGATNHVVATIPVGSEPAGLAYDAATGDVFVANQNSSNVSVISDVTNRVTGSVDVGPGPSGVAFDAALGEIFITNSDSGNVSLITQVNDTVLSTLTIGSGTAPSGIAYDPSASEMFVAESNASRVAIISDATDHVLASVNVSPGPEGLVYDNYTGDVFVADFNSSNVSVISTLTDSLVATIVVAGGPQFAAYDPSNQSVDVVDSYQGTVSILWPGAPPPSFAVNFTETGLAPGTSWSVKLGSTLQNSTTTNASFSERNGTYGFLVSSVPGYQVAPSSGYVTVDGAPVQENITFTALPPGTYTVTFNEVGLAPGTLWSVTLNGTMTSGRVLSIAFSEPNGTSYPFTVGVVPGYTALPLNGVVQVQGADVLENITFTTVPPPTLFSVSFNESGLPSMMAWTVTFNGTVHLGTGTTIEVTDVASGNYSFVVSAANFTGSPATGTVTVVSSNVIQSITFTASPATRFSITVGETGLLAGTSWSVTLGGVMESTAEDHLVFNETNGTYDFSVRVIAGYSATPASGSVAVHGAPTSVAISFASTSSSSRSSPGATFLGLPATEGYALLGGIVVAIIVAAALAALLLQRKRKKGTTTTVGSTPSTSPPNDPSTGTTVPQYPPEPAPTSPPPAAPVESPPAEPGPPVETPPTVEGQSPPGSA